LRWFFIFHSKNFPWLKFDDVLPTIEELSHEIVEIDLPDNSESEAGFSVEVPIKDDSGEVIEHKTLTATLFEFSFTQM